MLLQSYTSPNSWSLLAISNPNNKLHYNHNHGHPKRTYCLLKIGVEDIAEVFHNKVLIAAGVSAAIGQLSKPFTGSFLYGRQFDLMTAIQAGGFPSTHSSSVVAAATCLALERGFSDSIVGLTLVYAGLVMYDAQGVRREVGIHAKTLNRLIPKGNGDPIDGEQGTSNIESLDWPTNTSPILPKSKENSKIKLKESIGHTEVEVIAGAFLGFFVSLVVYAVL